MKSKRKILLISIIAVILLMAVGYAAFTNTELKINVNANATMSVFKVCFDHTVKPTVSTTPSVTGENTMTVNAPETAESATQAEVIFSGLHNQGDKAQATFTYVNSGDIDADSVTPLLKLKETDKGIEEEITTDDGVFTFTVRDASGGRTLRVGNKSTVTVEVTLQKRVETEVTGSCIVELTAVPVS